MSTALDVTLGIATGALAGASIRSAMQAAWRWGWGPQRIGTPGQTIVAALAAAVIASVLLLGLTIPLQPLVQTWQRFVTAWIAAFLAAGVFVALRRRKDAA